MNQFLRAFALVVCICLSLLILISNVTLPSGNPLAAVTGGLLALTGLWMLFRK